MKLRIDIKKLFSLMVLGIFAVNTALAGVTITRSNGMRFTGADGIEIIGTNGMRFTGADGFFNTEANGIRFTGADGVRFTGADGTRFTGADGVTYLGTNGVRFTGADGLGITSVDGIRFTGADGFRFTGADGVTYKADSIILRRANGVEVIAPAGISLIGPDGFRFTGADGAEAAASDGLRFTGADTFRFTGADSITGFDTNGVVFNLTSPTGEVTGVDGARFTGADTVLTLVDAMRFTGADGVRFTGADGYEKLSAGLESVDPDLALTLNAATDDSSVNAVLVFHQYPSENDLNSLRQLGIVGGTLFRVLPMIYVTATKLQLAAVSNLPNLRSIYGNRTLKFDSDPFFKPTQVHRVPSDLELKTQNAGFAISGKNVTVAVLDTGVNSLHPDLTGKVVQNVRLMDLQSAPIGFANPTPIENVPNTDLISGHGTFVAGIIAGRGSSSAGKYNGVAPGANILGLSAGDLNLMHVLSGFDYLLEKGAAYNVRAVNCSFSAETLFDYNDPVNIATQMLTRTGINVVFSAGNTGSGNATLNPYSVAPWVISVGATDEKSVLASFSSRGVFGDKLFSPTVVAPGMNVVSLRALGTQTGTLGVAGADTQRLSVAELPYYTTASGTSFSAPQVTGAIALMLEANPHLTPSDIKDILRYSATPLPNYYVHEVGAGMLNSHAAVLEAAFPSRPVGIFRSGIDNDAVRFSTSMTESSNGQVAQNTVSSKLSPVPWGTVQATAYVAWGASFMNNLGLKAYDANGFLVGASDRLNFPYGRNSECVTVNFPAAGDLRTEVGYSGDSTGGSTLQNFLRAIEVTTLEFARFNDIDDVNSQDQAIIYEGLRKGLIYPTGASFSPGTSVTRAEFAAALLRSGKVPQYTARNPMYVDVTSQTDRNAIESAQLFAGGPLFFDGGGSVSFKLDQNATRLLTAVALIKAAGLESAAATATLPVTLIDAGSVPAQYRGYVALALQKGWMTAPNNKFDQNGRLTRLELTRAMVRLSR